MQKEIKEGWAIPFAVVTWKYHYYRNGRTLCGKYIYSGEQLFKDVNEESRCAVCNSNLKYGNLHKIASTLVPKKYRKLKEVAPKYGNHLQYSLESHFQHLFSEVEELKEAIKQGDTDMIIDELVDISNMCDLIYDKIRHMQHLKHDDGLPPSEKYQQSRTNKIS